MGRLGMYRYVGLSLPFLVLQPACLHHQALEAELVASGAVVKRKNWPICYPLLHHDIPGEIPEGSRRVVREIYFCWYGLCVALLYNFFCASTVLSTTDSNRIGSWFLASGFTDLLCRYKCLALICMV